MTPLIDRVLRVVRAHELVDRGDRVAVALSGGADSVALLWIVRMLVDAGELDGAALAGAIHVNHGLRGDEAARDERFCRELAARLSLPIHVTAVDVRARARAMRVSIEAAARAARYECYATAMPILGATVVATGHTLEDQAETVLLRLLRGAGTRGLSGIRVRRGPFIRPLLECRRDELRAFLAERGEPFCEDSSNASLEFARNRVRHQLLPVIEAIAPGGVAALARVARFAAEDDTFLEAQVNELAPSCVSIGEGGVQLNVEALGHLPRPIARRMVRRAVEQVRPGAAIGARHLEAVLSLAGPGRTKGRVDVPGVAVTRCADRLQLVAAARPVRRELPRIAVTPLPVPGEARIAGVDVRVTAGRFDAVPDGLSGPKAMGGGDVGVVNAASVALPLTVRGRRPGDRFRPLGAPGRRKLQDVLVDRKIPREKRDDILVVVDADDHIVWVAGVAIAHECRVPTPMSGVVVLKVHR